MNAHPDCSQPGEQDCTCRTTPAGPHTWNPLCPVHGLEEDEELEE